jgi:AcrB/AcrD/AcrF family
VLAIAVRNVVTQIDRYQHLEQVGGKSFGSELVVEGTRDRFAPILTTALTTALALLPFVLLSTRAGLEIVHPMSVVILGGLVTSTLLSLFVVPTLYLRFAGGPRPAVSPADELMYRWAGITPEPAAAPVGANGDVVPAEPQVPAQTVATDGELVPEGDGALPGGPSHGGADAGVQTRGEE